MGRRYAGGARGVQRGSGRVATVRSFAPELLCRPSFDFCPRLVTADLHVLNPLGRPNGRTDREAGIPCRDRFLQARGAALAFAERPERGAGGVLGHGPVERDALAGPFLQRGAADADGLFQARGAALAFAEPPERVAEVVLSPRPAERDALAGPFRQRGAVGDDRLFQARGAALAFAE